MIFKFGYTLTTENNETYINFDVKRYPETAEIKSKMKLQDFKSVLLSMKYDVIKKSDGLFYKVLEGDVSGIEYEQELDALMDCYEHAFETNKI